MFLQRVYYAYLRRAQLVDSQVPILSQDKECKVANGILSLVEVGTQSAGGTRPSHWQVPVQSKVGTRMHNDRFGWTFSPWPCPVRFAAASEPPRTAAGPCKGDRPPMLQGGANVGSCMKSAQRNVGRSWSVSVCELTHHSNGIQDPADTVEACKAVPESCKGCRAINGEQSPLQEDVTSNSDASLSGVRLCRAVSAPGGDGDRAARSGRGGPTSPAESSRPTLPGWSCQ